MATQFFFGVVALIAIGFFLALAIPLLRSRPAAVNDSRAATLARRIEAIERDYVNGLIGEAEASEAIIEAKRSVLVAGDERQGTPSRPLRFVAIAYLALAPLAAVGVYLIVGAPALVDPVRESEKRPALDQDSIAAMPEQERMAMIEGMVASLAERLDKSPNDIEGWRMLARSQMVLQRPVDAAGSYRRLLALDDGAVDDWRNFASALAASLPSGTFPTDAEFLSALDAIETRAPGDPMVLFYRGGAARENGDAARAIELWTELLTKMPSNAPVRSTLEGLIEEARADP